MCLCPRQVRGEICAAKHCMWNIIHTRVIAASSLYSGNPCVHKPASHHSLQVALEMLAHLDLSAGAVPDPKRFRTVPAPPCTATSWNTVVPEPKSGVQMGSDMCTPEHNSPCYMMPTASCLLPFTPVPTLFCGNMDNQSNMYQRMSFEF